MHRLGHFLLFFLPMVSVGQNLVPNGSFEEHLECPDDLGQVENSVGWFSAKLSPDYFNACGTGEAGSPTNYWGYQHPLMGDAYMGFVAYQVPNAQDLNVREVLGVELTQALSVGDKYFVGMSVSLFNSNLQMSASNNIGAGFSTVEYSSSSNPIPIANQSLIFDGSIISDTVNWVRISGSFVSDSAYEFMYLGNLFDDAHTQSLEIHPLGGRAYYFVDEVCVSTDSLTCNLISSIDKASVNPIFSIYPNPASTNLTIESRTPLAQVWVRDVAGRPSIHHPLVADGTQDDRVVIDLSSLPSGIYLVEALTQNGQRSVQKVVVQ